MSEKKLLATIPRSKTEEIQVQLSEYKGKKFLDLRIFYTKDSGLTWNPSQKGVTVAPENLEALKTAIKIAQKEFEEFEPN